MDPLVVSKTTKEVFHTVTKDDRIFSFRKRVLAHARETQNVSETCRVFGISRTTFYRWRARACRYGVDGLRPRERRRPAQPNQAPAWVVEVVLAEAISRPTLGARRLLPHLAERGVSLSASGIQKILRRHGLGHRSERVATLAQVTAVATGQVTREAAEGPFGFCHFAAYPGDLLALDSFYVGKLKGIGPVWQLTAVDTHTRWAVCRLISGSLTPRAAGAFLGVVTERFARMGVEITRVLTDRGPEFRGGDFREVVEDLGLDHRLTPPRSPDHNAVCERFLGTVLDEFYRPTFHRAFVSHLGRLQEELEDWVDRYNTTRPNSGDYMRGRTPLEVLEEYLERDEEAA